MSKYSNVVRFKVKAEFVDQFVQVFETSENYEGMLGHMLIKTGDQSFCVVGGWESENAIVAARPEMIAFLDSMRHMLEEISPELGVTDPVSGPVVSER